MAIILIPALAFGGWGVSRSADSERQQLERTAQSKAGLALADIDREIDTEIAMLNALASSSFLQIDDFQAFRQQLVDVARQLDVQIVLADAKSGQQIVSTSIPQGEPLPRDIPKQASDARQ